MENRVVLILFCGLQRRKLAYEKIKIYGWMDNRSQVMPKLHNLWPGGVKWIKKIHVLFDCPN